MCFGNASGSGKQYLNSQNMKAIVYEKYGGPEVLQLKEVPAPEPKDNEVMVRVHSTAVSSGDVRLRKADPFAVRFMFGLIHPKKNPILGMVFAGQIEKAGKRVQHFKEGDPVYGTTSMKFGTYAEFVCLPETGVIALKPEQLSYQEAASLPFGALTALHFLRKANITKGQKLLIYGASGAVGTAAVQLARYFGTRVTAVCSTDNAELVKALGADKVIDYTKEDFSKSQVKYDIIFDAVGKSPFAACVQSLTSTGTYLRVVHMSAAALARGIWMKMTSAKKLIAGTMKENQDALLFLNHLVEAGSLVPVIDRVYELSQIADAHSYVEKGHKKGNVVITI
jgi:NADPH:quinone reductase-like Zn-dependent oxidoreductase